MSDTTPASDAWLRDLIDRSPLLADRTVRRAWRDLVPERRPTSATRWQPFCLTSSKLSPRMSEALGRRRASAWARWQQAAGWWRGWTICPVLQAPGAEAGVPPAPDLRAERLADALSTSLADAPGTLIALDLEPVVGVQIAARLSQRRCAHAVLLLPRWPADEAVLPTDELLAVVLREQRRLSDAPGLRHVVFVLDAARGEPLPERPATDRRLDNRYRLAAADLPNLAALRAREIERMVKVSRAG